MPLYGNELDLDTNPYEAGLGRVVKLGKPGDFVGRGGAREGRPRRPGAASRRPRRRGPRDRPARLPGLVGRPAHRRRDQRHAVADARGPDRDGLRRTGRRRAGYRCRRRDPRRTRARHGSSRCRSTGGKPERDGADRPALHEGPRVGPGRWRRGDGRDHRSTPPTSSATSSSSSCPTPGAPLEQFAAFGVVESVKAVSDLFAPVSGEVDRRRTATWAASPELVNSDPYGDGWMVRVRIGRRRPSSTSCSTPTPTTP